MKSINLFWILLGLFGAGQAAAQTWTVGPFTVEAVERRLSSGRFPNISGNPFERTSITNFRVLHKGKPIVPPGTQAKRVPPWFDVRQISGASQPALLLMEVGAWLLTEKDGQPQLQELAPREPTASGWQWLDSRNGQPDTMQVVGLTHRPDHVLELTGGRWLAIFGKTVLDTKTLAVHRFSFNSTQTQEQLQGWSVADERVLAFSPEGTTFVVQASRERPGVDNIDERYESALVAFDFVRQEVDVMPVALGFWRLPNSQCIDAAFAQWVVGWMPGASVIKIDGLLYGSEIARLREDRRAPHWLGRLTEFKEYELQPVTPAMQGVFVDFLEHEFASAMVGAPDPQGGGQEVRIEDLPLHLEMLRPQERRLSLFYLSQSHDPAREAHGKALVERIAERFNARLAAGEFQQYFVEH